MSDGDNRKYNGNHENHDNDKMTTMPSSDSIIITQDSGGCDPVQDARRASSQIPGSGELRGNSEEEEDDTDKKDDFDHGEDDAADKKPSAVNTQSKRSPPVATPRHQSKISQIRTRH